MDGRQRGIDEIIQKAMREGAFDNLPGQGQPLEFDDAAGPDNEWQLAYHILKENGFAPDFIETRKAIEADLAEARRALARTSAWRRQALKDGEDAHWVEKEWTKAKRMFAEEVGEINQQIRDYNLTIPAQAFYVKAVDVEKEISMETE